jgi:hypothetical protein
LNKPKVCGIVQLKLTTTEEAFKYVDAGQMLGATSTRVQHDQHELQVKRMSTCHAATTRLVDKQTPSRWLGCSQEVSNQSDISLTKLNSQQQQTRFLPSPQPSSSTEISIKHGCCRCSHKNPTKKRTFQVRGAKSRVQRYDGYFPGNRGRGSRPGDQAVGFRSQSQCT